MISPPLKNIRQCQRQWIILDRKEDVQVIDKYCLHYALYRFFHFLASSYILPLIQCLLAISYCNAIISVIISCSRICRNYVDIVLSFYVYYCYFAMNQQALSIAVHTALSVRIQYS